MVPVRRGQKEQGLCLRSFSCTAGWTMNLPLRVGCALVLVTTACSTKNDGFVATTLGDAAITGSDTGRELDVDAAPAGVETAAEIADAAAIDTISVVGPSLALDRVEANFNGTPGCPGSTVTFRVSNRGGSPSGAMSVLVTDEFALVTDGCSRQMLPRESSCDIEVRFRPGPVQGMKMGTLTVKADPGGQLQARLSGLSLHGDAQTLTPNSKDFGGIFVGDASGGTIFRVLNAGGSDLHLGTATVSTTEFVLGGDRCSGQTIPPGGTCELGVTFRPSSIGAKTAVLTLAATDCGAGQVQAALSGTALAADTGLVIEPGSGDFGQLCVPGGIVSKGFRVSNLGKVTRGPLAVTVQGPFKILTNSCDVVTLQTGGSCTLSVSSAATVPGPQQGKVSVTAPDTELVAALVATADPHTDLAVALSPTGFGAVPVGQTSAPVEATIFNSPGSKATGILTFSISNVAASEYTITENNCTAPLPGGSSCRVVIVFKPAAPGVRLASLQVQGGLCGGAGFAALDGTGI